MMMMVVVVGNVGLMDKVIKWNDQH